MMKFSPGGMGPSLGDNFRPGVGPKEIAPSIGGRDYFGSRPPGLIAPPPAQPGMAPAPGAQTGGGFASSAPQGQEQMVTHMGPGSGLAGQMPQQTGLPLRAGPSGSIAQQPQMNQQQMMMQRIMQDPFIMRIMQARQAQGFGGSQFRMPFAPRQMVQPQGR